MSRRQLRKLPASARKFLRREKARIRREAPDHAEAEQRVKELVAKTRLGYTGLEDKSV
ncbi:MAG: hypothetical protein AAB533_04165 [Patescibacteria group bacterium]